MGAISSWNLCWNMSEIEHGAKVMMNEKAMVSEGKYDGRTKADQINSSGKIQ